jgi:hypothetical protein
MLSWRRPFSQESNSCLETSISDVEEKEERGVGHQQSGGGRTWIHPCCGRKKKQSDEDQAIRRRQKTTSKGFAQNESKREFESVVVDRGAVFD